MNRARLLTMVRKEFTQMRRDKATLRLMLGIPVIQLLLFGYAIRTEVRNLPTTVLDMSRTQESRAFVQRVTATGYFRAVAPSASYADALAKLESGRAKSAIVIPGDYARDLKRGRQAQVQVLIDATDPTAANSAIASAQMVGQQINLERLRERSAGIASLQPAVDVRVRPLYNPALKSSIFEVPGIIGMILSNILIIVTALSIVRERETGTLEQLIVTPLQRSEIMLGKIAPYVLVGMVQLTAVLILGRVLFDVPIRGPIPAIYAASLLFIVANLGLGLFISTLGRTQAAAMQGSFFFLLPNVLLSGFMFPREAMPPVLSWIGATLPLTHFLLLIRGIVLKGVGFTEMWPQVLALVGFAVAYFTFATRRFSKTLE